MSTNEKDSAGAGSAGKPPEHQKFQIQIDRDHFTVTEAELTGAQLRKLPTPPIGPERDLFEVVPGGTDLKISDSQIVTMRNGLRFFTAPGHINPGQERRKLLCCQRMIPNS